MNNQTPSSDQFISFQEFFTVLKDNYQKAFLISAFFVMMSTIYSFSLTEQFTSEVTFKVSTKGNEPSQTQGSGLSISSLLSGKGSTTNLGYEIVSIIKSRSFFNRLLQNNPDILPMLFAADSFNYSSKSTSFDEGLYNVDTNEWLRDAQPPFTSIPSNLELHEVYNKKLNITIDDDSSLITASFTHVSPIFSSALLEEVIINLNEYIKSKDLQESSEALEYLEKRLQSEPQTEIRKAISSLVELQLKKNMFSNLTSSYAVEVIDAPFIPEIKSSPQKSIIIFLGLIAGFLVSLLVIFIPRVSLAK